MTTWTPIGLSALHHKLLDFGATMVDMEGWQVAGRYTTPEDEIARISKAVGLVDFSPATKLNIQGEAIDDLLRRAYGEASTLEVGRVWRRQLAGLGPAQHAAAARLAHDELLMLTAPGEARTLLTALSEIAEGCTHLVDVTSALCSIRVTGPHAPRLMSRVTELDLRGSVFPDMSCAQGKLSEIECTVLRHDIGGLTSFELYFSRDYGEYLWDSLLHAGEDLGVTPYGTEALLLLAQDQDAHRRDRGDGTEGSN